MRAPWLILLLLGGCDWLLDDDTGPTWPPDTGDTGDTGDTDDTGDTGATGCPQGMTPRDDLLVSVRDYSFNVQNLLLSYDPDATWEGEAAGCASADRLAVRVLLLQAGEPYAWLTSDAPRTGQLSPMVDRSLMLDLFGESPAVRFDDDAWFQGVWSVQPTRLGAYEHTIDATGRSGNDVATLQAFIEVP